MNTSLYGRACFFFVRKFAIWYQFKITEYTFELYASVCSDRLYSRTLGSNPRQDCNDNAKTNDLHSHGSVMISAGVWNTWSSNYFSQRLSRNQQSRCLGQRVMLHLCDFIRQIKLGTQSLNSKFI